MQTLSLLSSVDSAVMQTITDTGRSSLQLNAGECSYFLLVRLYAIASISCWPVFVCRSVIRWYCIETAARIELVLLRTGFPRTMLRRVVGKLKYLQNITGLSLWNFVPKSAVWTYKICPPSPNAPCRSNLLKVSVRFDWLLSTC